MITIEIRGEKEVIDALRDFKAESDLAIMKANAQTRPQKLCKFVLRKGDLQNYREK